MRRSQPSESIAWASVIVAVPYPLSRLGEILVTADAAGVSGLIPVDYADRRRAAIVRTRPTRTPIAARNTDPRDARPVLGNWIDNAWGDMPALATVDEVSPTNVTGVATPQPGAGGAVDDVGDGVIGGRASTTPVPGGGVVAGVVAAGAVVAGAVVAGVTTGVVTGVVVGGDGGDGGGESSLLVMVHTASSPAASTIELPS